MRIFTSTILSIFIITFCGLGIAREIYQGNNKDGTPSFSDKPIPGSQDQKVIEVKPMPKTGGGNPTTDLIQQQKNLTKEYTEQAKQNAAKRAQLIRDIRVAEKHYNTSVTTLNNAKIRSNARIQNCHGTTGSNVVCTPEDLAPLELEVSRAKNKLQSLREQLRSIPR